MVEIHGEAQSAEIRIYVACLAAYNGGRSRLHGVWIDATDEFDDIQEQVNMMLKESPEPDAEEWAIIHSLSCECRQE